VTLLGPRFCHVQKWSVVDGVAQPAQILGRSTWEQFTTYMISNRATRLTYDLYECVEADGTLTRYRATDVQGETR
jgi:hypothetical protein